MTSKYSFGSRAMSYRRGVQRLCFYTFALAAIAAAQAQDNPQWGGSMPDTSSPDKIVGGYVIHQSIDIGGHITEKSGSDAMYATLVNLQSGARVLDQSLTMRAVDP